MDADRSVSDRGGIELTTGDQRLYGFGRRTDFPVVLSARAAVYEWYDDDADRYRIEVSVRNPIVGRVFEYRGAFDVEWVDCATVPEDVLPTSPTQGE